ncbi:MAG: zinc ABC transporter substrate-binding protein [bacterium]|nr:zinc ABC transporter substrate-binding protein [bacterium]
MRIIIYIFFLIFSLFYFVYAQLNIVATYPWIGDIVKQIGKEKINIHIIGKGTENPHYVVPKPSHIAQLRKADLLIIQGASIEVGFLQALINQSNNPKIQPGKKGFLDLSNFVQLIEKPENVSRAMGDIHPEGNPHYNLDPNNFPPLATIISQKMIELDSDNKEFYQKNMEEFLSKWEEKLKHWNQEFSKLSNTNVIQYHPTYNYFLKRYGIVQVGTIEPLPGIPPTPKHIEQLITLCQNKKISFIINSVYYEKNSCEYLAKKIGAKFVILPHDVGSLPEVKDIFNLFDKILETLSPK